MSFNRFGRLMLMKLTSGVIVLAVTLVASTSLTAQNGRPSVEAYLIAERDSEIALARSAAPKAISHDATILVLTRRGFEIAVKGSNGFVCFVERSWLGPFDFPDMLNPRIRGAQCMNPEAARSILPLVEKRTALFLDGRSIAETIAAMKASIAQGEVPALEPGAMAYMMSRSAYLYDQGDHNGSHLMFYAPVARPQDWGVGVEHSPVVASVSYWFISPNADSVSFPPLVIFAVPVSTWSDGSPTAR